MFEAGNLVHYQANGVCVVEEVGAPVIRGRQVNGNFYTLRPLSKKDMTLFLPVKSAGKLRALISKEQAQDYMNGLETLAEMDLSGVDPHMISHHYSEVIHSGNFEEWLGLLKLLQHKRHTLAARGQRICTTDDNNLKQIRSLVLQEMSLALGEEEEQIWSKMEPALES